MISDDNKIVEKIEQNRNDEIQKFQITRNMNNMNA